MSPVRVRYETIEFPELDLHVRSLRDRLQFSDDDGEAEKLGISSSNWPLFGVLWESGRALARLMAGYDIAGRRILEVGCGIGLASLVLNHRGADISCTDHHPEVEQFLRSNAALNGDREIPFERTDWADTTSNLGRFDLIIASDLLYERGHAEALSQFIDRHARPICEVILVDPGRGQLARFARLMLGLGYAERRHPTETVAAGEQPYAGQIAGFQRG